MGEAGKGWEIFAGKVNLSYVVNYVLQPFHTGEPPNSIIRFPKSFSLFLKIKIRVQFFILRSRHSPVKNEDLSREIQGVT